MNTLLFLSHTLKKKKKKKVYVVTKTFLDITLVRLPLVFSLTRPYLRVLSLAHF